MAFHIVQGSIGTECVDGMNAVMVNEVPGNMRAGGYRTAVYVDVKADNGQRVAIEDVFTGKAGGVLAGFGALTDEWLGVKSAAIEVSAKNAFVKIPSVLDIAYEPMKGIGGKNAALIGTGQRIALGKRLNVARSTVSRYVDYDIDWDSAGCNVFWGRFSHSNAAR